MDLSEFILEPLRTHEDFTLYQGRRGDPCESDSVSILLMAPKQRHTGSSRLKEADQKPSLGSESATASYPPPTAAAQFDWRPVLVLDNAGSKFFNALVQDSIDYRYLLQVALEKTIEQISSAEDPVERENGVASEQADRRRRQAEEALEASERNFASIINTIPTLAWSARPDGHCDFLSQGWLDFTGLTSEQAQGWGWSDAIHPGDKDELVRYWKSAIASGVLVDTEARLRRADGVYRWTLIRANPWRDESGVLAKWYGTNTDIDDRKRAEEAVLASERNLRLTIDTMPVLSWSALPDGAADFFNKQWLDYTGLSLERAQGQGWVQAFHPDDLDRVNDYWRSNILSGKPGEVEARLRRSDGKYRWFLLRGNPVYDESGAVVKWFGTNTDIDDRKQAEEELTRARAELAHVARVTSLGVVAASIVHEVNQPLSGIVLNVGTCLRMLDCNPPNIEGARETARRAIRDGNRASEVVTRLRALFKRKEVAAERVNLNDAAQEVIALSLSELQSKRIVVRHEFAEGLPAIKGDRIQLQQVIQNLLRNASDSMICIHDRPRQLLIRTESHGNGNVQVTVQDTGIGIAPDAADRLFDPLFTTKEDGMGIGLSVSRSIVEAHRGQLWAKGNDGPGVSFIFSIPSDPNAPQPQE